MFLWGWVILSTLLLSMVPYFLWWLHTLPCYALQRFQEENKLRVSSNVFLNNRWCGQSPERTCQKQALTREAERKYLSTHCFNAAQNPWERKENTHLDLPWKVPVTDFIDKCLCSHDVNVSMTVGMCKPQFRHPLSNTQITRLSGQVRNSDHIPVFLDRSLMVDRTGFLMSYLS